MGTVLSDTEYKKWWEAINVARRRTGLTSIASSGTTRSPAADVRSLLQHISGARSANKYLILSDYTAVDQSGIDAQQMIRMADHDAIQDNVVSLLRVCANITCQTACTNSGRNSNQYKTNLTHQNQYHQNEVNQNVVKTNGSQYNGQHGNGTYPNGFGGMYTHGNNSNTACIDQYNSCIACGNGSCPNQYNGNVYKSNVVLSNGPCPNQYQSNGDSNQIYDPATAVYGAKNYYAREEAENTLNAISV